MHRPGCPNFDNFFDPDIREPLRCRFCGVDSSIRVFPLVVFAMLGFSPLIIYGVMRLASFISGR